MVTEIFIYKLSLFGQPDSLLEIVAMLTGLVGVWLTVKQNTWCFPVGIINVILYAWLFFSPSVRLYADALLQCIYVVLLSYGWYSWSSTKKKANNVHLQKIHSKHFAKLFFVNSMGIVLLAGFLQAYTDASLPWLDSALTCLSLSAQWMIAKKYIENWYVWIAVNSVYIPLYLTKQLPLTALLYAVFLLLAVLGYKEWKKKMLTNAA